MAGGKQGPGGASRKGRSTGRAATRAVAHPTSGSSRYTPPVPRSVKVSPKWMGPTILAVLILGLVTAGRLHEPKAASLETLLTEFLVATPRRLWSRFWPRD